MCIHWFPAAWEAWGGESIPCGEAPKIVRGARQTPCRGLAVNGPRRAAGMLLNAPTAAYVNALRVL